MTIEPTETSIVQSIVPETTISQSTVIETTISQSNFKCT